MLAPMKLMALLFGATLVACGDDRAGQGGEGGASSSTRASTSITASRATAAPATSQSVTQASSGTGVAVTPCAAAPWTDAPIVFGSASGIDLMAAAEPSAQGGLLVVYETFDVAFDAGSLRLAHVCPDGTTQDLGTLDVDDAPMVSTPSLVSTPAGRWLYYTTASSLAGSVDVWRRAWGEPIGPAEAVTLDDATRLQSFPRFTAMLDGAVGVALHDAASRPAFALAADGVTFGDAFALDPQSRALARATAFASGAVAVTYQTGANPQIQRVRIAADPASGVFTPAVPITDASQNVHDASALLRGDGALDLYYIYVAAGDSGFGLHRRRLDASGGLGPEVAIDALGEPSKPNAVRLPSGEVALMYAEIVTRDAGGQPSWQRMALVVLPGDS